MTGSIATPPSGSHACPRCRAGNSPSHHFCVAGGQALQASCSRCGFVHESGARFCGGGGPVLADRPAVGRFAAPDASQVVSRTTLKP